MPEFSMEPVAERLRQLIKKPVILTKDVANTDTFKYVRNMKDGDIEQWYDDIYQMCLLAFLELDHLERKERVKKLKEDIQKNG